MDKIIYSKSGIIQYTEGAVKPEWCEGVLMCTEWLSDNPTCKTTPCDFKNKSKVAI